MKSEFEVVDDFVNDRMIFDKSDHFHLAMTVRTDEGIDLKLQKIYREVENSFKET